MKKFRVKCNKCGYEQVRIIYTRWIKSSKYIVCYRCEKRFNFKKTIIREIK